MSESGSEDEGMDLEEVSPEWTKLNLSAVTLSGLKSMGFLRPTKIQESVIPLALHKRLDILGAAETGSGKTLAFVIPIIERWLAAVDEGIERGKLFALIITPTRELALQIRKELERLASLTSNPRLRSTVLCGGINQQKQERLLKKCPDVIVATPGRLWGLIEMGEEYVDDLSSVRMLVVDEVDRMLEKGHFQELGHIVTRIHANINETTDDDVIASCKSLQTLIFSATLTFTHAPIMRDDGTFTAKRTTAMKVDGLVDFLKMRLERQIVDVTSRAAATPAGLVECRMHCADLKRKDANLYYLLNRYGGRTLVFTNSVDAARRLYNLLNTLKFEPAPRILHAKMLEQKRLKNLEKFAETENSVLLATDVASRGLDIRGVQNVIHYQMPRTSELYVHRSGRTARALQVGLSVLFVDPTDLQSYKRIRKNLHWKEDLEVLSVDSPALMEACCNRIDIASGFESAEFGLKKASARNEWFRRLAEEADIILDDDLVEKDEENGSDESPIVRELRLKRKALERTLNAVLKQPLPTSSKGSTVATTAKPSSTVRCKSARKAAAPAAAATAKKQKQTDGAKQGSGKIVRVVGGDVQSVLSTDELREKLHLQKNALDSLKRHFKKKKRAGKRNR